MDVLPIRGVAGLVASYSHPGDVYVLFGDTGHGHHLSPIASALVYRCHQPDSRGQLNFVHHTEMALPTKPDTPVGNGLSRVAACSVAGSIFVFGGLTMTLGPRRLEQTMHADILKWCGRQRKWEVVAQLTRARAGCVVGVIHGKVYIAGGEIARGVGCPDLDVFDPNTLEVKACTTMSCTRSYFGGAVMNGRFYAIGGQQGDYSSPNTAAVERYDPDTDTWEETQPMPTSRFGPAAAAFQGRLWVLGGWVPDIGNSSSVLLYDEKNNSWSEGPDLPHGRACHRAIVHGEALLVLSGNNSDYLLDETVDAYIHDSWYPRFGQFPADGGRNRSAVCVCPSSNPLAQ